MNSNCTIYFSPTFELYHHGITGQKWGVRRFQNDDGSLTSAGRRRYGVGASITLNRYAKKEEKIRKRMAERYTEDNMQNGLRNKRGKVKMTREMLLDAKAADEAKLAALNNRRDALTQVRESKVKRKEIKNDVIADAKAYRQAAGVGARFTRRLLVGMGPGGPRLLSSGFASRTYDLLRSQGHGKAESFIRSRLDLRIPVWSAIHDTARHDKGWSLQRQLVYNEAYKKRQAEGY